MPLTFKQNTAIVLIMLLCMLPGGACHAKSIHAVATFSVVGDIVRQVAGEAVDLTVLVGANADAHEYEPTPQDAVILSHADVIFENGFKFEGWLDKLYASSNSNARRVVVSEGARARTMPDNPSEIDPHAWQNIQNGIIYARNIAAALKELDPSHTAIYEANVKNFVDRLTQLDQWGEQQLKGVKNRTIVTNHEALGYFADRYGFTIAGAVIPSTTTEASDPSARQMARLIEVIQKEHVRAIFAENASNSQMAKVLADQAGVRVVPGLYTDALGTSESKGSTYEGMMRANIQTFTENLE